MKISIVHKKPRLHRKYRTTHPFVYRTVDVVEIDDADLDKIINEDKAMMAMLRFRAGHKIPIGATAIIFRSIGNYGGPRFFSLVKNKIHRRNKRLGIPNEKDVGTQELTRFVL